jgi:Abnormal spindle-like microcephaly-assoc'd, ASPM-SPD-2-Hydin
MITTGAFNWNTRIANFKFPGCTGNAAPAATLTPISLTFPTTALAVTSAAKTVTLTNSGTATLNITSITATGDFAVKSTTCGLTLAAGASCKVNVTFTPTAINARTGNLTFVDDAANSPQSVSLKGTGTAIAFSPTSAVFSAQLVGTISLKKSVTITNKSAVSVTFSGFALAGTNPGDFHIASNGCGSTLAAGANCAVGLTFQPTAIGTRRATLNVSDNGGGSPQVLQISGIGTIISLTPTKLSFGTVTVGTTSVAQSVTVANKGTVAVSFTGFAILGTNVADFLISSNSCGTSLAAGAHCVVQIKFKPTATGARSATLNGSDNGGGSPQKVLLAGSGG